MITSMHIENFKCFKEFDIELGPFNVLIGPNDSGKTAFLQAVQLIGLVGERTPILSGPVDTRAVKEITHFLDWDDMRWRRDRHKAIRIRASYEASGPIAQKVAIVIQGRALEDHFRVEVGPWPEDGKPEASALESWWREVLGHTAYYLLNPSVLRQPSTLTDKFTREGKGFPAFLDSINRTDREAFFSMEKQFYRRFPYYRRMELPIRRAQRTDAVFLEFRTAHGQVMAPESVSDGVMLSLASLAIAYQPDPPKTLLMEEPDKGVHHGSLRETITTLKQLSEEKGVQVILTTHSPYLLDEVEPERVHVFTKDGEGAVHAKRLSEFEDVDGMKKDFMTGEIWSILSKAHGI